MTRKDTFICKAILVHGDKYSYDHVHYVDSRTKVQIKCNTCHIILHQTPAHHLIFKTCSNCILLQRRDTFIQKSRDLYGDKFDYSLIKTVVGINVKVPLICKICNMQFSQYINSHLQGTYGCKNCWKKSKRLDKDDFIKRCKILHKDAFDYSLVEFANTASKINIKCNVCKTVFEQQAGAHLYHEHKCLVCTHNNQRKKFDEFVKQSIDIHGDKYDYSFVEYINAFTPVKIKCKKCQTIFEQKPSIHLSLRCGCPKCNLSKGESKCQSYLNEHPNVKRLYTQYRFKECKMKHPLPFDFQVVLQNDKIFMIEYNGKQHYEEVKFFSSSRTFDYQKQCDEIKKNYCSKNNIPLLIIKYTDYDVIENIINDFITKLSSASS
jgi:hypothetical protein